MKKRLISLFLIIATMSTMLFAGCGGSKSESKPEALAGDHSKFTTLDKLEANDSNYIYLYRKEKRYHIGQINWRENPAFGMKQSSDGDYALYSRTENLANIKEVNIISAKDVPVPIIQNGDKIYVEDSWSKKISIRPVEFVGYTPLIIQNSLHTFVEEKNQILNSPQRAKDLSACAIDKNGNAIVKELIPNDILNLKYNQEVDISIKNAETDEWHTYQSFATCSYYEPSGNMVDLQPTNKITIKDSSFSIYDPTVLGLKEGYYAIYTHGDNIESVFYVPSTIQ